MYADLSKRISETTAATKPTEDSSKQMDAIGEQVSDVHYWGFRFVNRHEALDEEPRGDDDDSILSSIFRLFRG